MEEGIDKFIRHNDAISILKKVMAKGEPSFSTIVSSRDPFGLNYYENGVERSFKLYSPKKTENSYQIYYNGWQNKEICYADKKYIKTNQDAVNKYKIFISKANGNASSKIPYSVLSQPFIGVPGTICNMTYLLIGAFNSKNEAENAKMYITTKFFRFLVSLIKNNQNACKPVYTYVPLQDFSKTWTDQELYEKYGLSPSEVNFIETMIKPMDLKG